MNISKSRLIQIIKEEVERARKTSAEDKAHEGKTCSEAHGAISHKEWAAGKKRFLMPEELEELEEQLDY